MICIKKNNMIYNITKITDINIDNINNLYNFIIRTNEGLSIWFSDIKIISISEDKFEFKSNREFNKNNEGTFDTFILKDNTINYTTMFYFDPVNKEGKYIEEFDFQYTNQNIKHFFNDIKKSYSRYSRH